MNRWEFRIIIDTTDEDFDPEQVKDAVWDFLDDDLSPIDDVVKITYEEAKDLRYE